MGERQLSWIADPKADGPETVNCGTKSLATCRSGNFKTG
jgi:hypothetical protein